MSTFGDFMIGQAVAKDKEIAALIRVRITAQKLWESSRCEPVGKDDADLWIVDGELLQSLWAAIKEAKAAA